MPLFELARGGGMDGFGGVGWVLCCLPPQVLADVAGMDIEVVSFHVDEL